GTLNITGIIKISGKVISAMYKKVLSNVYLDMCIIPLKLFIFYPFQRKYIIIELLKYDNSM
ncbi:hypothetical protein C6576_14425, partial [Mammaliicoccus sciuri]